MLSAEWAAIQATIREIHSSEKQHQAAERNIWAAQLRAARGLNRVTGIGAAVGILGLVFVALSLRVTQKAAEDGAIAARAAERQARILADQEVRGLRAYVFPEVSVENVNSDINKVETIRPQIHMIIKNSGHTPAYYVSVIGEASLIPFPATINEHYDRIGTRDRFGLAAEGRKHAFIDVQNAESPLTPEQKLSLKKGTMSIVIVGEIIYYDTFRFLRCTSFLYYMGGDVGLHGEAMAYSSQGQEVDTNCHEHRPGEPARAYTLAPR